MDRFLRITFISIGLLLASVLPSLAQDVLRGRVVDSDGVAVPNASVSYKGRYIAVSADGQGRFSIERHNGWEVTVSAVGYKSKKFKVKADEQDLLVKLREDSKSLKEVAG